MSETCRTRVTSAPLVVTELIDVYARVAPSTTRSSSARKSSILVVASSTGPMSLGARESEP
jgi:hypothetical protein